MPGLWYGGTVATIHHHSRPFVTLNGRLYAVSNVAEPGSWSSVYPTPAALLPFTMLRRVYKPAYLDAGGCGKTTASPPLCPSNATRWTRAVFGPIFWATDNVPPGFDNVSLTFGIRTAAQMTGDAQVDVALFRNSTHARAYTTNACRNGPCPDTDGEQTVYALKNSSIDVVLHRGTSGGHTMNPGWPGGIPCPNRSNCVLLASSRDTDAVPQAPWSPMVPTTIPDIGSNLNAGVLSDGRVFLVWSGVPRPEVPDIPGCGGTHTTTSLRDPLTIALSSDGGLTFDKMYALFNSTQPKRFCGFQKGRGASYPQAREVIGEGADLDGLWTVYSINKEDVGVTFVPLSSLTRA